MKGRLLWPKMAEPRRTHGGGVGCGGWGRPCPAALLGWISMGTSAVMGLEDSAFDLLAEAE